MEKIANLTPKKLKLKIIQYIYLSIVILLNFVFLFKYLSRIDQNALLYSIIYGILQIVLYLFFLSLSNEIIRKSYTYLIVCLICLIQLFFLFKIDVNSLNIDRWSVITSFLNELLNGNFPYLAKSHLNNPPGPFPGYFIFALPFYLIGEIGLYSLSGVILFFLLLKYENIPDKSILVLMLLIFTSATVWYELVVRSTIIVNMVIALIFFSKLFKTKLNTLKSLVFWGLLGGLVLSTRGIMIYVMIIYFTSSFLVKKEWYKFVVISLSTSFGFLMTLVPFIIWDWQLFLTYNPITLQANFIPTIYLILFAIIAFVIGYKFKNIQTITGLTGILLFLIVSIPFFINVLNSSLNIAIVENGFDISYFLFSIPFLIYAIQNDDQIMLLKA